MTIDEANKEKYRGRRLFLEDGGVYVGVASNQTFVGDTYLSFTDYLGDHRLIGRFAAVDTFSNFDFVYADLSRRWNWTARVFDYRDFYYTFDEDSGQIDQQQSFRMTGVQGAIVFPIDFYHRVETGLSYISRKIQFDQFAFGPNHELLFVFGKRTDRYPQLDVSLVGDTAMYANWGAVTGRRWQLRASYAHDAKDGGALARSAEFDGRQYFQVSERTNLAFRLFAGYAGGNAPLPYFFGGLDTVRGVEFRTLIGTRAAYANVEYRFPLLDVFKGPFWDFRGIRGRVFLDVGAAWFAGQDFEFWDSEASRLRDGVSAYGWGLTLRFGGLDLNWDFAQQWDFKDSLDRGFRTEFWIGTQF